MTYYKAKFEREAKENPLDWVIAENRGVYYLKYIGVK